jgi:hypothetical protein
MRNLIVVAFLEPVTEGLEFPRDDWPLHITLVKFDVVERQRAAGEGVPDTAAETTAERVPGDPLAERIAALMDAPVAAALGSPMSVGAEAGFGRTESVPVSLIEPGDALQSLHEALVQVVAELPGRISTPGYALDGYRPHVSHLREKRLNAGDVLVLDRIALVDMAPDGGHATRRVLRLWTA